MGGAAYVILAAAVCGLAPGLAVTSRLPWSPLEKLVGGVGLSLLLVHLGSFAFFLADAPTGAYVAATLACGLGLLAQRRALFQLARDGAVRRTLGAFTGLLAWLLLLLLSLRHFSGGDLAGDWIEHTQRTQFFARALAPGPVDLGFRFIGLYLLPARPPLENVVAAFLCRPTSCRFELVALAFTLLNATAFLPGALLLARLGRRGRRHVGALALLFALNPFFTHNATFTWTKLLAAGYVLLGVWFYLRSLDKPRGHHLAAASLSLAAGILTHYSAAPFALALVAYHLLRGWRWTGLRPTLAAGALGAAALATWLAWSLAVWGPGDTFLSNTAATDSARLGLAANASKVLRNVVHTLVPHGLRGESLEAFASGGPWSLLRDAALLTYQPCLPAMAGVAGGPLVAWLFVRSLAGARRRERGFWVLFTVASFLLGVGSHGTLSSWGVAQIVLQPLGLLALALLAAGLDLLPRGLRRLLVLGCAVDFALGVYLHFRLEALAFALVRAPDGRLLLAPNGLSRFAAHNWGNKLAVGAQFWGDHLGGAGGLVSGLVAVVGAGLVLCLWRALRDAAPEPGDARHRD